VSLPLTTEQLTVKVTDYGRPMRANTITKIEKGQRRVDVGDPVALALALALETRPDALLLPPTIADDHLQLTEGRELRCSGTPPTTWPSATARAAAGRL
jgi:hypothetical protein